MSANIPSGELSAMGHIEIKKRKGKKYAYYVKRDSYGKREYKYLGAISKTPIITDVVCSRCGKILDERTIKRAITNQLIVTKENMIKKKEHISDYARFAIVNELIKAFSDNLPL